MPVRTARAISASASCSQVEALSSPVLVSIRDWASSCPCIMKRRTSSTVGTAKTDSSGLTATTMVISTPRSNSAKSATSASRLNSRSANRTVGSVSLIPPTISTWCPRRPTCSATATATAQVSACTPVPIAPPANEAGNARNSTDAAP